MDRFNTLVSAQNERLLTDEHLLDAMSTLTMQRTERGNAGAGFGQHALGHHIYTSAVNIDSKHSLPATDA